MQIQYKRGICEVCAKEKGIYETIDSRLQHLPIGNKIGSYFKDKTETQILGEARIAFIEEYTTDCVQLMDYHSQFTLCGNHILSIFNGFKRQN